MTSMSLAQAMGTNSITTFVGVLKHLTTQHHFTGTLLDDNTFKIVIGDYDGKYMDTIDSIQSSTPVGAVFLQAVFNAAIR